MLSQLDYTKSYTLQTQAVDALDTAQTVLTVMPGIPTFHWKKERFTFRVPVECHSSISGAYISKHTLYAGSVLLVMEPGQTVLLMGAGICGVVGSSGNWWGSEGVAAQSVQEGVQLTFPAGCSGEFLFISARPVCIE